MSQCCLDVFLNEISIETEIGIGYRVTLAVCHVVSVEPGIL